MPTDNLTLSITTEELNNAYMPTYNPLFPILTKQRKHTAKIGQHTLKQSRIIGDAKARIIETQDTEWKHAKTGQTSKSFNKFMKGIKHIISGFQDTSNLQATADEILDINLQDFDEDFWNGDPTESGVLRNNGFWNSNDPNYITLAAQSLPANPTQDDLKALFDAMLEQAEDMVGNAAKTFVLTRPISKFLGKILPNTGVTYLRTIMNAYQDEKVNVTFETAPANLSTAPGIALLTPSQVTLDYIEVPNIRSRGFNDEDIYTWLAETHGSVGVDVEKKGALIKQEITIG